MLIESDHIYKFLLKQLWTFRNLNEKANKEHDDGGIIVSEIAIRMLEALIKDIDKLIQKQEEKAEEQSNNADDSGNLEETSNKTIEH